MPRPLLILAILIVPGVALAAEDFGGGGLPTNPSNCIPPELEAALRVQALARFGARHSPAPRDRALLTLYADPMGDGGINSPGKTVQNYVDLDPTSGVLDWNCGITTYDGHSGIDIELRDFVDMDEGVPILAAAPGVVVDSHDGEFDRQTAWISGALANYAVVLQADGSYAYYWHMRKGSVRVSPSQTVAVGDTLGMVGSSGFSTNPHLHFETWAGATIEPDTGPCQSAPTWWNSQGAYVWTYPGEILTHGITTLPVDRALVWERPPSKTRIKKSFNFVYSWIRGRNLRGSDLLTWNMYSPSGLQSTVSTSPSDSYTSSYWYRTYMLTNTSPTGAWHVDILLNGVLVAQQFFTLNTAANQLPTVATQSLSVPRDGSVTGELVGTDSDGSVFWYDIAGVPLNGTATLFGGRRHRIRYVPTPGYVGKDSMLVRAQDDEGATGGTSVIRFTVTPPLAVEPGVAAGRLELGDPWPNPVASTMNIEYVLPSPAEVRVEVLDVSGRRVTTVLDQGPLLAGEHRLTWDGHGASGRRVPPGIYLVRVSAGSVSGFRRIVVVD